ncbi:MAG: adenosylcobinamide-GDP ribazoletransferase [Firmicutes bacterium]|nr:adenosylcobinamide-GDP ribazoletransferase [Bacillota bacterium]
MKSFVLMLSFFTRLPVPYVEYEEKLYIKGIKTIPFVGIVLGLILYLVSFLTFWMDPEVSAVVLLMTYIFMTGGLHLDGLADTCDGVFSGRDRERMLEIMKDSRIGSFGVLAMLFFFIFYAVMYQFLPREALLILPVIGKSAPLISASLADYARPSGMGQLLVDNIKTPEVAVAVALPLVLSVVMGVGYIIAAVVAELSVVALTKWLKKKLGGITGDTHGMVCEVSQMVFAFCVYVLIKSPIWYLF